MLALTSKLGCAAQLLELTMDELTRQVATIGLASDVIINDIAVVGGYTLEAQMRTLNNLTPIDLAAQAPSAGAGVEVPAVATTPPASGYVWPLLLLHGCSTPQLLYQLHRECFVQPHCKTVHNAHK